MIPEYFFIFKPKNVDKVYDLVSFKCYIRVRIFVATF